MITSEKPRQQLLQNVCGSDPLKWQQALESARKALVARCQLWDGVKQAILIQRTTVQEYS